jgi:hypothetical protein
MTDRELLELAAQAAGIDLRPVEIKNVTGQGDDRFIGYMADPTQCPRGWFDPLTDDGDALRLAVKLHIELQQPTHPDAIFASANGGSIHAELLGDNAYAATRRAIVRAAAEIGKGM